MDRVSSTTHEAVWRLERSDLGLTAFIAIHSTRLGPAFGGARVWRYTDEASALTDALRLSEGMTYKNAMADLGAGGGKSVLMLTPEISLTAPIAFGDGPDGGKEIKVVTANSPQRPRRVGGEP